MNSVMNRWLVSGTWLFAVMAVISASTKGAIGTGAMWSMPAALAVTMAAMGWPEKPMSRLIAALGVVWQIALIGAYWPFAAAEDPANVAGPMKWSTHSIVILVLLLVLTVCFAALYVMPAIALIGKIKRAARLLLQPSAEVAGEVALVFAKDPALAALWQQYLGFVRSPAASANSNGASSLASAKDIFEPMAVSHTRLRLDFFRNLPGVFTGIGIIGTFSGLISGLRAFQISQDPSVVQRSLESLLTGVWGAFLISAVAIALAIVVTLIEKVLSSALAHHLDEFATLLDGLHPPQPADDEASWMPRLVEALSALGSRQPAVAPMAAAERGEESAVAAAASHSFQPMAPMAADAPVSSMASATGTMRLTSGAGDAMPSFELSSQMLDIAQSTRAATLALNEMAGRMPDLLAQTLQGANQNHQQSTQVMRALASRLENVASGIELSARKTLETVASRLMQSEMNMVSRHHAVADHLGELVQRIEALCGLMQQDRADLSQGNGYGGEYGGSESAQPSMFAPTYGARGERDVFRGAGAPSRGAAPFNAYPQAREPGLEANGFRPQANDAPSWQDADDDLDGFAR
jgi:MotA/TolQ/ExbB proton channel family